MRFRDERRRLATYAPPHAPTIALESLLSPDPAERRRALVADDDRVVRALARAVLAPAHVIEATNGTEAVALAFSQRPELIVLDRKMPGTSGIEALRRLRSHAATRTIPVVMLSAFDSPDDVRNGMAAGADAYLPKSQLATSLGLRVETVLARCKAHCAVHPLTKLPGAPALRAALGDRLLTTTPFSLIHTSCQNLGELVATRGCDAATDAIRAFAMVCYNLFIDRGTPDDNIAHIGGDEIVILADITRANALAEGLDNAIRRLRGSNETGPNPGSVIVQVEVDPAELGDPWELGHFIAQTKLALQPEGEESYLIRRTFPDDG